MRILVVFAHPSEESFGAAIFRLAIETLQARGHDVRALDLYRMGFDPVLSPDDWRSYQDTPEQNAEALAEHVEALRWAQALVVIYPTWMYGPPAILKGWLERVWLPGVAFEIAEGRRKRPKGLLKNIRLFIGITTSGTPWWWIRLIGDPGRSTFMRGFRILFAPACRMRWLQLYDMNHATGADRERFLVRVRRALEKV